MTEATKKDDGGPAFPEPLPYRDPMNGEVWPCPSLGLTKREYFAAMAMRETILSHYADSRSKADVEEFYRECAEEAVGMADALIAELKK